MKRLLLSFSFLLIAFLNLNAQSVKWAKLQDVVLSGWGADAPYITTDGDNVISAGRITNTITFGSQVMAGNSGKNGYLAKHGPAGNLIWARHIGGAGAGYDMKATTDNNKNIYLVGGYRDSLVIGNTTLTVPGPYLNLFIAKFDPAGNLLWARHSNYSTTGFSYDYVITTDGSGNLFFGGGFQNSLSIGTTIITPIGAEDVFLGKFDSNGNLQWLKTIGTTGQDNYASIISGAAGNVYLAFNTRAWPATSTPEGHNLKKFNSAGVEQWSKFIQKSNVYYQPFISQDAAENVYLAAVFDTTLTFGNNTITYTQGAPNNIFLAKVSPAGNWKWTRQIQTGNIAGYGFSMESQVRNELNIKIDERTLSANATFTNIARLDTAGNIIKASRFNNLPRFSLNDILGFAYTATDNNGNTYFSGITAGNNTLGPVVLNAPPPIHIISPRPSAGFIGNMALDNAHKLTGTMFIDWNINGLKDSWELPFENGMVEVNPGPLYTTSTATGTYTIYVPDGNYSVQVVQPANHYTISPQTQTVTFSGNSQSQTRDFALTPIPNRNDVKVSITNFTPARPGFTTKYRLTFENIGINALSDTIILTYNSNFLSFNTATTPPVSQQPGKIRWFYQTLLPNQKRNIDIEFTVATSTPLSTTLQAFATIKPLTGDFNTENNYDTLNQVVTGSFDPNDKQVNHTVLNSAQVARGEYLDYVIRFQNTGTDTAFTVVVRDTLSSKLQMPTFELLSASHPYTFRLLESSIGEWRFENILLPDSNRNEPASHGFIRYRMKPKSNLVLGDEINGKAAIYFDFNQPVITNDAITLIANPTGINSFKSELQSFNLYPNPARNYVMVAADFKKQTSATVRLVNLLGQVISEVKLPANNQIHYQLPLKNLPKGVYIIQLETEAGRQTQRLVVQ